MDKEKVNKSQYLVSGALYIIKRVLHANAQRHLDSEETFVDHTNARRTLGRIGNAAHAVGLAYQVLGYPSTIF